jgi:hypothetical protein
LAMVTLPRGLGGERGSREEGDGDSGREGEEEDEEERMGKCRGMSSEEERVGGGVDGREKWKRGGDGRGRGVSGKGVRNRGRQGAESTVKGITGGNGGTFHREPFFFLSIALP